MGVRITPHRKAQTGGGLGKVQAVSTRVLFDGKFHQAVAG